jgi:cobalt/nickel transport system permease protein
MLLVLVGVTLVLAAASHVGVGSFARKVWASAGLLALLIALPSTTALITPGAVVVPLGPVSLTQPGLMGAATLVARVVAAAGFSLLVVWTMRWTELLHALTALGVPGVIVATLAMAHKQILTLLRTVEQIHLARESRTVAQATTAENRSWVTERMTYVVRKSMKTADDVYDAMLSRGFSGPARSLVRLHMGFGDWAWAATCVLGCTAIVLIDRMLMPR